MFPAVTEAELLAGCAKNHNSRRKSSTSLASSKIPVDNALVQHAARIRRESNLKMPDAIIAASELVAEATSVTRNNFRKTSISLLKA